MQQKLTTGDKVFYIIDYVFIALMVCITLYPFLFIISSSISDTGALQRGEVWLFPVGINFSTYQMVLADSNVWSGYYNTIWYVAVGTTINITMTLLTAYPLSRKTFSARNTLMMIIAFTMFFSGGLVPSYLLLKTLKMINTRWAIVIPAAISTWNLIILRTSFESIPESLHESAIIDGCPELKILFKIYLPLSIPTMAVMVLFYAVGHWNSYFSAMIYLNDADKFPLQLWLREMLIMYDQNDILHDVNQGRDVIGQSVRYATIIVSTLPILMVYPFLQKYFMKGVMIGAIKG